MTATSHPTPPLPGAQTVRRIEGPTVIAGDHRLTRFGGCNYLALNQDPTVLCAAADAIARLGLSAAASRTTTGETIEHTGCERALSTFCGFESCVLLPDGFTANIAAMQTLAARVGTVVVDERAHHSLRDAAGAAGLPVMTYHHLDPDHAAEVARATGHPVCIATDSVFAANGAVAPVRELHAVVQDLQEGSVLLADECHAFAGSGDTGRGMLADFGLIGAETLATLTLAKGLGCAGGAVLSCGTLEPALRASGVYVGTTPASPPLVAASRAAIDRLASDDTLMPTLHDRTARLHHALGIDADRDVVVPFLAIPVEPAAGTQVHAELIEQGFEAPLIAYPGGPAEAYFRITVTRAHTPDDITRFGAAFTEAMRRTTGATT